MTNKKSFPNEPAFPNEGFNGWGEPFQGMDLRDYFAAKALPIAIQEMNDAESYDLNDSASLAYSYADAMMKARQSND
jgi:hypothetical protein